MTGLFVDTSGWGHLVDSSQGFHSLARGIYLDALRQRRQIVTTNYIIAELAALMSSPLQIPKPKASAFIESLKVSPYVEIVHVDETLDDQAWLMLKSRQDKNWSLVDCASFVIMQQRQLVEALTTDHHFEQAGFARLLKQ